MNNTSKIVFLINDDVRAVKCRYNTKEEKPLEEGILYKTLDPTIKVGDLVVVPTGTRHGYTVVEVDEVDVEIDFDNGPNVDWIVSRLDTAVHLENIEKEKEAIKTVQKAERARKRRELKDAMFADHEEQLKTLAIANVTEDDDTAK